MFPWRGARRFMPMIRIYHSGPRSQSLWLDVPVQSWGCGIAREAYSAYRAAMLDLFHATRDDLNRIERVLRFIKGKLANHRFWNDRPGLTHAANLLLHGAQAQFTDARRPNLIPTGISAGPLSGPSGKFTGWQEGR